MTKVNAAIEVVKILLLQEKPNTRHTTRDVVPSIGGTIAALESTQ